MDASISEGLPSGKGAVAPAVDSPGFRKSLQRFLQGSAFPPGVTELSLDPFAPQTPPVTARLLSGPAAARKRFDAALQAREWGVLTPQPLAWAETAPGKSVFFVERIPDTRTMQEALLFHYYEQPLCEPLMNLLQVCADAVRTMHQAGWEHGYLTTEHLLVRAAKPGIWQQAWVQGMTKIPEKRTGPLPPKARGRDNGGITLPSDFLRVFLEMQWAPEVMPPEFRNAERKARRSWQDSQPAVPHSRTLPEEQDIWIWDHRSVQAIPSLKSRDKRKYYRKRDAGPLLGAALRWGAGIRRETRNCLAAAWSQPVELDDKIGISLNLEPHRFEQELKWLSPLGTLPVLVRIYHHESEANQRYAVEAVRRLHAQGHHVTVALVQDRRAILQPNSWQRFVERNAGGISGFAEAVEVGHAINRVKWGIWNLPEYRNFIRPFENWHDRYPQLPLMGPAGIDFEFPRILPLLNQWPKGSFSALSHHLYVDRRGAPENTQNGHDLVHKLAMARAIARVHPACEEKVVVSEVNWPLLGTGVWSPVGSPYQSPGERTGDPSVDEDTYADYLQRYLLLALCSGLADRVFWWNLAAHGFGLVDDRDPNGWRARPGYHMFKEMVELFRNSRFEQRRESEQGWTYHFTRSREAFIRFTPHL